MKKIVTLFLAVLMIAAVSVPAIAADATGLQLTDKVYKSDDGVLELQDGDWFIKPGQTIYIELEPVGGETVTTKLANSYHVYTDWRVGKNLVESTKIEYKRTNVQEVTGYKISDTDLSASNTALFATGSANLLKDSYANLDEVKAAVALSDIDPAATQEQKDAAIAAYKPQTKTTTKYVWYVALTVKSSFSVKAEALNGTIRVGKSKADSNTNNPYDLARDVKYGVMSANDGNVDSKVAPVVNFKDVSDEIELNFGDTASFTVDVTGQDGKMYMGWNEKPNSAVINANPTANIDFISFDTTPSFNRIGTFKLFSEDAKFIYQVGADGSLKKVDATYDESEECFVLKTRTLGSYVVSDIELQSAPTVDSSIEAPVSSAPASSDSSAAVVVPTVPGKPNPGTGAAA